MPLSALCFYIESKYHYELIHSKTEKEAIDRLIYERKRDAYLMESLHALITLPYGSHYKEFMKWHEFIREKQEKPQDYTETDVINMFKLG